MAVRRAAIAIALVAAGGIAAVAACASDEGVEADDGGIGIPSREDTGADTTDEACARRCLDDARLEACTGVSVCPLGCLVAESRCFHLDPSGPAEPLDYLASSANIELASGDYVVDTDDGSIRGPSGVVRDPGYGFKAGISYRAVDQPNDPRFARPSPGLGVFGAKRFAVGAGATLRVRGARALAIVVEGDAVVDGAIYVGGDCDANAPVAGGYGAADGIRPGGPGSLALCGSFAIRCVGGSGGAGAATAGGNGGTAAGGGGGPGGAALPTLDGGPFILIGGSGGGSALAAGGTGIGGAGGGAVQIAAGGAIKIAGTIDAAGCGGRLGATGVNGGGGGGAGGMIVLESPVIDLGGQSVVAANGGGGASGASNTAGGAAGAAGGANGTPAPGGNANGCPGGAGGAGDASAGIGTSCVVGGAVRIAAGGGGGYGRIAINGVLAPGAGSITSPDPIPGTLTKR